MEIPQHSAVLTIPTNDTHKMADTLTYLSASRRGFLKYLGSFLRDLTTEGARRQELGRQQAGDPPGDSAQLGVDATYCM